MNNHDELFQKIYKTCHDVYKEIFPDVNKGRGVLYDAIRIILDDNEEKINEICNYYEISPKSYLEEDLKFAQNYHANIILISIKKIDMKPNEFDQIMPDEVKNNLSQKLLDLWTHNHDYLYIIIVLACLLVGIPVCAKFLEKRKNKGKEQVKPHLPPEKVPKISSKNNNVALYLVVPAYSVINLKVNSSIKKEQIKELIDKSAYFLCTSSQKIEENESGLNLTQETPLKDSPQDFYIRIDIENGDVMKEKTTKYDLKEGLNKILYQNLFTISRLNCLKRKTGLEKFNRI